MPPVLFMWYIPAASGWPASTIRAGLLSDMSTPESPISTTMAILPGAPPPPPDSAASAAMAALRLSSLATVTLIVPVYGMPVPLSVMFVPGASATLAGPPPATPPSGLPCVTPTAGGGGTAGSGSGSSETVGCALTVMFEACESDPGAPGDGRASAAGLPAASRTAAPSARRAPVPAYDRPSA